MFPGLWVSWIVWFIYHRQSHLPYLLDVKHGLWQLALLAVLGGFFSYNYHETSAKHGKSSERIIQEYKGLATLGSPDVESLFYIQKTTSAPKVTISIFSDFQCPFCKKISEQMHEISRRFKDTLQINYYFFPLDGSCNSEIKGNMHPLACLAAKIASCDQNKFLEVHDKIFSSQENLSETLLEDIRKSFQLDNCPPQEDFIKLVASHVAVAKSFNVKSTPTFILNGKKIEGMIPTNHLAAIIEDLIKN